jgi:acylphosphatase
VGFRWYVYREADKLGLGGFAHNLPDGSVEVVSEGPEKSLEALERALRRGPPMARVETLERFDVPAELDLPKTFDIK